jgi:hypothetical protein
VNRCKQSSQAAVGRYVLLVSRTWKSFTQPDTRMACPVLFSTTTYPDIDDAAVIVRDGRRMRAVIGAERWRCAGVRAVCGCVVDAMWLLLEHPARSRASKTKSDLTSS